MNSNSYLGLSLRADIIGAEEEGAEAFGHCFFVGVSGEMEGNVAVAAEVDRLGRVPCLGWDVFECCEDFVSGVGGNVYVAYDEGFL